MKLPQPNRAYVIINNGWMPDVFLHRITSALCRDEFADCHPIGGRTEEGLTQGWSRQLVGFGGEHWRGMVYYGPHGKAKAVRLIPNFDAEPEEVTLATCGIAVLTGNKFDLVSALPLTDYSKSYEKQNPPLI